MEVNIGNRISELRRNKNITQTALGKYLNVSNQTISKWENGVTFPDIQLIPEIAAYFGVSIDYLFDYQPVESTEMQVECFSSAINRVVEMMNVTRKQGLMALELYLNESNDLERYGLELLLNGRNGSYIEKCMQNMSVNGYGTGDGALDACIIAGITGIGEGQLGHMCKEVMLSIVPKHINAQVRTAVDGRNLADTGLFRTRLLSGELKYEVTGLLEFIRDLPNEDVRRLIRCCKQEHLVHGLFGASSEVCMRIFGFLSEKTAAEVLNDMYDLHELLKVPDTTIRKHQQEMIKAYENSR